MVLVQHDNIVQALSVDRTDPPLDVRRLLGRPWRTHDFFEVHALDSTSEELTLDRVTIAKQGPRRFVIRKRLDDLLGGPLSRRMGGGDVEAHDISPIVPWNNSQPPPR